MMKPKMFSILFISALCILGLCVLPVSAHKGDIEIEIAEIIEHADDLFDLAEKIHDETELLSGDESLPADLRDLAYLIHEAAHELEHCAEHLQEDAAELLILVADPVANRPAINRILADMREEIAEYTELLASQHDNIHELEHIIPASHDQHAKAIHDAAHKAERDARHLLRHIEGLEAALDEAASPTSPSKPAESPGFGALAAAAGLIAVAYATRRE